MIDLHSHLLFGIDDGAGNESLTRRMLEKYAAQGVTTVAATSHSAVSPAEYRRIFSAVSASAFAYGIELVSGREYALADAVEQSPCLQPLGKGAFFLVDLGVFHVSTALCNRLEIFPGRLLLAHPERLWHTAAVENARFFADRRECFFQLNSGSFLGHYGKSAERTAWQLLNHGFCSVIASDAHCDRGIDLAACRKLLERYFPAQTAALLFEENPQRILTGQMPLAVSPCISLKTRIRQFFHPWL